jgi:hypothetical protein
MIRGVVTVAQTSQRTKSNGLMINFIDDMSKKRRENVAVR